MDHYDDIQIEEFYPADFVEEVYEELFDENEDDKSFQRLINTNYDFWLWHLIPILSAAMLLPSLVWLVLLQRFLLLLLLSAGSSIALTIFVWHLNKCLLKRPPKPKLLYPESMTDTVNVLPHLNELKDAWRKQDFKFTKQQSEEYELLIQARRERVKWHYETDKVCKISKSAQDKLKDADWNINKQEAFI